MKKINKKQTYSQFLGEMKIADTVLSYKFVFRSFLNHNLGPIGLNHQVNLRKVILATKYELNKMLCTMRLATIPAL